MEDMGSKASQFELVLHSASVQDMHETKLIYSNTLYLQDKDQRFTNTW